MLSLLAALHIGVYLITSAYYAILDYYRLPKCDKSSKYPTTLRYLEVAPNVIFNLAVNVLIQNNLDTIVDNYYNNYNYCILVNTLGFAICTLWADIWFYTIHRYIHYNRLLYRYIHKTHHIYADTFAFSAFDSNIIEHLVVNIGSVSGGPLIAGYFGLFDKNCTVLWILFTTYTSCTAHSGYSPLHYLHHKYIDCNYGQGVYLLDTIFGTYRSVVTRY